VNAAEKKAGAEGFGLHKHDFRAFAAAAVSALHKAATRGSQRIGR
jgi:hypothetical protein